jgi:hypothetical protein
MASILMADVGIYGVIESGFYAFADSKRPRENIDIEILAVNQTLCGVDNFRSDFLVNLVEISVRITNAVDRVARAFWVFLLHL